MKRPILNIPPSKNEKLLVAAGALGVLLMFLLAALNYNGLPDRIPIHFGFTGKPDAYGPKAMIWSIPALSLILFIVLTSLTKIPHTYNYPVKITETNVRFQYQLARSFMHLMALSVVILMLILQWNVIMVATGKADHLNPLMMLSGLALIIFPIFFYSKAAKQVR